MTLISYTEGWGEIPWGTSAWGVGILPLAVGKGSFRREQHDECSRCGNVYPLSELIIQSGDGGGRVVCIRFCLDEPSRNDLRPDELPKEAPLEFVDGEP